MTTTPKIPNKRKHWGEICDDNRHRQEVKPSEMVSAATKLAHLIKLQATKKPKRVTTKYFILKNPFYLNKKLLISNAF